MRIRNINIWFIYNINPMSMPKEAKTRKAVFINYYTKDDYEQGLEEVPKLVEKAERRGIELMEPNLSERVKVRSHIRDFIRRKGRKIYGGTAINELLKAKNPKDAIYDEYNHKDIEFYSTVPVVDLLELCDELYKLGFKKIQGKEAQHEGTYSLFVNYNLYCDISYVPTNVYNGIKTIEIDGVKYIDPHFIFIDHLRMYTAPLTAFNIWEKNFKRSYKLLKHYPLEHFGNTINLSEMPESHKKIAALIKKDFLTRSDIGDHTMLSGFDAYNFYITKASDITNHDEIQSGGRSKAQRKQKGFDFEKLLCNVPFMELVSVNYQEAAVELFDFIKGCVPKAEDLYVEEYHPLFNFTGYSLVIKYKDVPLVKLYEADGLCVPAVKIKTGLKYVSFHYVLMTFLMHKFKSHLDKEKDMYRAYGSGVSNLVEARNMFLENNELLFINNTIFSEFRITCIGSTMNAQRAGLLRTEDKHSKGKVACFRFKPEEFDGNDRKRPDPSKHKFPNISGNLVRFGKGNRFRISPEGNLVVLSTKFDAELSSDEETCMSGECNAVPTEKAQDGGESSLLNMIETQPLGHQESLGSLGSLRSLSSLTSLSVPSHLEQVAGQPKIPFGSEGPIHKDSELAGTDPLDTDQLEFTRHYFSK